MNGYTLPLLQLMILATTGCSLQAQRPAQVPAGGSLKGIPAPSDWTNATKLPKLRASIIKPKRDADDFICLPHEIRFSHGRGRSAPGTQFLTDAEAQAAALAWIDKEFGGLPKGASLRVSRTLHSASGNPEPKYGWDKGHTVVLQELYNLIPTLGSASIYISGKTVIKASLSLYRFESEDLFREILSPQRATKILRDAVREGLPGFQWDGGSEQAKPRLEYDRDPLDNTDMTLKHDVLTPTWIMDVDENLKVNAVSGRFWIDD